MGTEKLYDFFKAFSVFWFYSFQLRDFESRKHIRIMFLLNKEKCS